MTLKLVADEGIYSYFLGNLGEFVVILEKGERSVWPFLRLCRPLCVDFVGTILAEIFNS